MFTLCGCILCWQMSIQQVARLLGNLACQTHDAVFFSWRFTNSLCSNCCIHSKGNAVFACASDVFRFLNACYKKFVAKIQMFRTVVSKQFLLGPPLVF